MDDRVRYVGVCCLGSAALLLCGGLVLAVTLGREIPPGFWATLGATLGALAGLLPSINGRSK